MATKTRTEQAGMVLDHLEGCPAKSERTERYESIRPADRHHPDTVVTVTHCVDCGNEAIDDGSKRKKEAADGGDEG